MKKLRTAFKKRRASSVVHWMQVAVYALRDGQLHHAERALKCAIAACRERDPNSRREIRRRRRQGWKLIKDLYRKGKIENDGSSRFRAVQAAVERAS